MFPSNKHGQPVMGSCKRLIAKDNKKTVTDVHGATKSLLMSHGSKAAAVTFSCVVRCLEFL